MESEQRCAIAPASHFAPGIRPNPPGSTVEPCFQAVPLDSDGRTIPDPVRPSLYQYPYSL